MLSILCSKIQGYMLSLMNKVDPCLFLLLCILYEIQNHIFQQVTPHDFHQKTGLRSDGPIINLENESGIQLGIDLLGCRYSSEHIHYFDLENDYRPPSLVTLDDCARMARAFLLYLLGAYLFANEGQTMSLRWLALFRDFKHAWEVNWGQACLAYLYSVMDTLSQGTLH